MLDRVSCFADEEVLETLHARTIPVALDVWYEQRREDAAGEFYRSVVLQRDGASLERTTQGFYLFSPDGHLLNGWNHRATETMRGKLKWGLARFEPPEELPSLGEAVDARYRRALPEGAAVIDVFARILAADWPEPEDPWQAAHREGLGRDHLWILEEELRALREGVLPASLGRRLVRYHLVDNTRGEPPMWDPDEVLASDWKLVPDDEGARIEATVDLATEDGSRGFRATGVGRVAFDEAGGLQTFDLTFEGPFWGEGRWTSGGPPGVFRFAVAFRLNSGTPDHAVPPQGARSLRTYLSPH